MKHAMASFDIRQALHQGLAIPAHPLALDANRRLDERHQRALSRYYLAAGAGGLAVAVHTTQFAIREAGLLPPVLTLAAEEARRSQRPVAQIAGLCGPTAQAIKEAELARHLGYHAGLLSLAALRTASEDELVQHCQAVAETIPVIGFYLQPSVGGRALPLSFWRRFVQIDNVVATKIAPFNRYQTLDVIRAVIDAGRDDIALYTGNDDNIVGDLVTPFRLNGQERRIQGGLLGHWSVWTRKAVELLERSQKEGATPEMLALGTEITDCNAAFFDAANGFRGCIAGLHEVLKRQGLLKGLWCLDEHETLSPGQKEEIARVQAAYPHLNDDAFVARHLDEWLK